MPDPCPLLRTRGGHSIHHIVDGYRGLSSPHARRSFPPGCLVVGVADDVADLFFARAEVIPAAASAGSADRTLLRTRGGHSDQHHHLVVAQDSSPHARRSFEHALHVERHSTLFSARAEVIPHAPTRRTGRRPLLRTRGGHSSTTIRTMAISACSAGDPLCQAG